MSAQELTRRLAEGKPLSITAAEALKLMTEAGDWHFWVRLALALIYTGQVDQAIRILQVLLAADMSLEGIT